MYFPLCIRILSLYTRLSTHVSQAIPRMHDIGKSTFALIPTTNQKRSIFNLI